MFKVIKLVGKIEDKINTQFVLAFEYLEIYNVTLLYCFCTNYRTVNQFYETLKNNYHVYLLPQTYHDVYRKNYYYDHNDLLTNQKTNIRLFENLQFITNNHSIFLETKSKRQKIKEKIIFTSIEELKTLLMDEYEIKFLVPFFYSLREMKEFMVDKKIKVKDLSLLYLLENKTLEGKKTSR